MLRFTWLASLAVAAVAVVLAGCGSSSGGETSSVAAASTDAGGTSRLALSESEFKITPAHATVAHTGTVTITVKNDGAVTHALAIKTPSGVVKTSPIAAGATGALTVDLGNPGSYTLYCPIPGHQQAGMQGALVVG
jgi:uncharacterized cupredoxin-like copper-binding protein